MGGERVLGPGSVSSGLDIGIGGVNGACLEGLAGLGTHSKEIEAFEALPRYHCDHLHFTEKGHFHRRQPSL